MNITTKTSHLAVLLLAINATAQTYPAKGVRLVVPFPPGGPADAVARPLAQKLSESLGQPVVVDNRPGATGTIGASLVAKRPRTAEQVPRASRVDATRQRDASAKGEPRSYARLRGRIPMNGAPAPRFGAPPDGYTLLLGTSNELTMSPGLYEKLPYNPSEDFTPLTPVIVFPNILVTHPALPPKTVAEFVALARARPGALNFATSGPGSTNHLTGELFRAIAKVKINFVPYKGGGPAVVDLMGGHVEAMFATMPSAISFVHNGKLKALLVTDQKRWRIAPDVPSAKDAGMLGVHVITWNGVLGPAGLPATIRTRLHTDILSAANTQDMKDRMAAQAAEVSTTSAEEFAATLKRDFAQWVKVIKDSGMRLN